MLRYHKSALTQPLSFVFFIFPPATGYSLSTSGIADGYPVGIAIDGSGNVWVANSGTNVMEIVGAATPVVTPLSVGVKNNTLGTRP